jgi:hypothetical protein
MKSKLLAAAAASAITAAQPTMAQQYALQVWGHEDTQCMDQAVRATNMPASRMSIGSRGQYILETKISEDYVAQISLSFVNMESPLARGHKTLNFNAQIDYRGLSQSDGLTYSFRRSVSTNVNTTSITGYFEGGYIAHWNGGDYGQSLPQPPVLTDDEHQQIRDWVIDTSNTLTFMFSHCRYDEIYEPSDQSVIKRPILPVISGNALELQ